MYPDCYGIDMSQLGRFIAFEAAVALLHDRGDDHVADEVEQRCLAQADSEPHKMVNHVASIYERFTLDDLSAKIAALVRPRDIDWQGDVQIIYQSIDGLRAAIPDHAGVWYFTGEYPTPGGYKVLNTSFLNWRRACDDRAYEIPSNDRSPPDADPSSPAPAEPAAESLIRP
jgi:amidophosphoribosyltransferase